MEEKEYPLDLKKVHVKEWKKDVYIRPITLEEQLQWEASMDEKNPIGSIALLVSLSVCDAEGNPLWNADKVKKLPAKIVRRLHLLCAKTNGLRKEDFDELLKNSEADQPE